MTRLRQRASQWAHNCVRAVEPDPGLRFCKRLEGQSGRWTNATAPRAERSAHRHPYCSNLRSSRGAIRRLHEREQQVRAVQRNAGAIASRPVKHQTVSCGRVLSSTLSVCQQVWPGTRTQPCEHCTPSAHSRDWFDPPCAIEDGAPSVRPNRRTRSTSPAVEENAHADGRPPS
jgi:hypothetical protein